jgi:hypothetical protein
MNAHRGGAPLQAGCSALNIEEQYVGPWSSMSFSASAPLAAIPASCSERTPPPAFGEVGGELGSSSAISARCAVGRAHAGCSQFIGNRS